MLILRGFGIYGGVVVVVVVVWLGLREENAKQ